MNDLAERLRQIERNHSPDLWDEITSRPVDSTLSERRGPGHRIAAGLVAALVSIAAFAFLVIVFRSEPDREAVGTSSPLTIQVRTTNDPFDVHLSATFEGEEIDLVGIETPGPDLEYPNSAAAELPVGTPIVIDASEGITVSVFELDPAQGKFVVEDGSCLISGSLRALPGPGETAFFVYAEGEGWASSQAFRAETIGESLDHGSALDPSSTVDANTLGLATCDADHSYLPLVFSGGGWDVSNFGSVEEGTATKAWASTVAIDDRDLGPRKPAIPRHTIGSLPPGEAVIVALATPWHFDPNDGPYPPSALEPLDLSDATIRGPEAEEPEGNYTIYDVQNGYTAVRVFFRSAPTEAQVEEAQAELSTLQIPPTCPVGYETMASPAEAEPGQLVTLTGPMPFQFEDGSFDVEGRTLAIAWWNADQQDWPYLSSFSTRSPSPVSSGPIVRLGEGGVGRCAFSITFTVPEVPPGDYPIVLIHESPLPSPDGSALLASLSVRVR